LRRRDARKAALLRLRASPHVDWVDANLFDASALVCHHGKNADVPAPEQAGLVYRARRRTGVQAGFRFAARRIPRIEIPLVAVVLGGQDVSLEKKRAQAIEDR